MKDTATLSDGEFHHHLLELVHREFGKEGLSRFMTNYCEGKGDYTRDRHIWLDDITADDLAKELTRRSRSQAA